MAGFVSTYLDAIVRVFRCFRYNRVFVIAGFHCSWLDALNLKLVLHPNKTCFAVLLLTMKICYLQ